MIACLECDEWYHDSCVGLDLKTIQDIESYVFLCPRCKKNEKKTLETKKTKGRPDTDAKLSVAD